MIAVVLYHAHIAPFSGGYIGVDVFFVISGFLITSIILPDIQARRFRLGHFYERRIRRILPALFTVMAACFIAAWWLFLPGQFESFAHSAMATVLFVSNIFFRTKSEGYFASSLELSPLLHTWSLAVEEQLYIFYPLALYLAVRLLRRRAWIAIVALMFVSFFSAALIVGGHPNGAFYRTSLRAWEFMSGAILAFRIIPGPKAAVMSEAAATTGAALVLWSIFAFSPETTFPGANALYPCIGTALILYAGLHSTTVVGRFLSFRPMRGIGLISYSLYLWHWPILVFCRQYFATLDLGRTVTVVALLLSVALSWLTWLFVEQPARRSPLVSPKRAFSAAGIAATLTFALAGSVIMLGGIPLRLSSGMAALADAAHDIDPRDAHCSAISAKSIEADKLCRIGNASAVSPTFVLWGDSHANAEMPGVDDAAKRAGITGVIATDPGCPPLIGLEVTFPGQKQQCRKVNTQVLDYIRRTSTIDTVILAGRWAIYAEGTAYGPESMLPITLRDSTKGSVSRNDYFNLFRHALEKTVLSLQKAGKRVVLVGPVPEVGWNVPKWLAIENIAHSPHRIAPRYAAFLERQEPVLRELSDLKGHRGVAIVYPHRVLCGRENCEIIKDGHPLYIDDDHLSVHGAMRISSIFDPVMAAIRSHPSPLLASH